MGCGLRREIERMMKILGRGPWHLRLNKSGSKFRYLLIDDSQFARDMTVDGVGASKKEALENLLETWISGKTELEKVSGKYCSGKSIFSAHRAGC